MDRNFTFRILDKRANQPQTPTFLETSLANESMMKTDRDPVVGPEVAVPVGVVPEVAVPELVVPELVVPELVVPELVALEVVGPERVEDMVPACLLDPVAEMLVRVYLSAAAVVPACLLDPVVVELAYWLAAELLATE